MRGIAVSCVALLTIVGCSRSTPTPAQTAGDSPNPHAVLQVGDTLEFRNSNGTMKVHADSHLKRTFSWGGASRSATMYERKEPWYGALGLYFPGTGDHWDEHQGVTRGVLQEQTRDFATTEEFGTWFKDMQKWYDAQCSPDGLVAGWSITPDRNALNVELWRVTIEEKPPIWLKDASTDWFTWTKAN